MKRKIQQAALAGLVLGAGILIFTPGKGTSESAAGDGGDPVTAASSKSGRAPAATHGGDLLPAKAGPGEHEDFLRERTARIAEGNFYAHGPTFDLLPVARTRSADLDSALQGASAEVKAGDARDREPSGAGSLVAPRDLAARAVAHKRDRREFMRERLEELSRHTPGCKCAYHTGRK